MRGVVDEHGERFLPLYVKFWQVNEKIMSNRCGLAQHPAPLQRASTLNVCHGTDDPIVDDLPLWKFAVLSKTYED